MATWTEIPDDFGSGGKGLSPSGSHGTPTLKDLLQEVQDNIDLNTDITDNTTAIAALDDSIHAQIGEGNAEEISSSGALSVVVRTSRITVSGTKAYTLADGTIAGQRKTLFCVSAGSTPHGVVTPAHPKGYTSFEFATANGGVELEWDSTATAGWKIVCISGTVTVTP